MPRNAVSSSTGSRWPIRFAPEYAVSQAHASTPGQCRCGTFVPVNGIAFGIGEVPRYLEILFRRRVFCSVACIRAYCLESLEILDSLDTPGSGLLILDLPTVREGLVEIVVAIGASSED
jgi:hypothetical protein